MRCVLRSGISPILAGDGFALKNISFSAKLGELVGIIGRSGCGKSTLLNILAANIVPDKARVRLLFADDRKLDSLEGIDDYRARVGLVSQESHIFSESLAFNISLQRKPPRDFDDFWADLVEKIPYLAHWGISPGTVLDRKSVSLGQRQLLAAIRAFYLRKAVVLFDEIASGLDSDLEEALRSAALLTRQKSITFIVAHRLETILGADRIWLMRKGEIISTGSHYQLYRKSSIYRDFILQLS